MDYDPTAIVSSETSRKGYDHLRTSNWLTILGKSNINLLGGKDKIKSQFTDYMSMFDFNDGIIIRAGDKPTLGNSDNGGIPQAYKTVAKIIKPIVFQEYSWGLFQGIKLEEKNINILTPQWFNRFD